ncbi:MAG: hypothetical protein V1859_01515 [archaeon]
MKMKKAQMQIMQNTMIMIMLIFIFMIALIVFISFELSDQKEKMKNQGELETMRTLQFVGFLSELQCSENGNVNPDCFDKYKAQAFKQKIDMDPEFKKYYEEMFGFISINLKRLEPSPEFNDWDPSFDLTIYNNPKSEYTIKKTYRIPVMLKQSADASTYFGVMTLEVYS